MRAFIVSINGVQLCTAGIGTDGVLSSHVSWTGKDGNGQFHMHVGGLDTTSSRHMSWPVKEIGVGDEITTRIVETKVVDAPYRNQTREEIEAEDGNGMDDDEVGDSMIEAELMLFNRQTGGWEPHGSRQFSALPRIGEWVEIEQGELGVIAKIAMVTHSGEPTSSGGVSLYATIEGETSGCLKRLTETLRPDLSRETRTETSEPSLARTLWRWING
jgi:hypothetical protein